MSDFGQVMGIETQQLDQIIGTAKAAPSSIRGRGGKNRGDRGGRGGRGGFKGGFVKKPYGLSGRGGGWGGNNRRGWGGWSGRGGSWGGNWRGNGYNGGAKKY